MSAYAERLDRRLQKAEHELMEEKQGIPAFLWQGSPFNLLAAPLIYSLIVPFVALDVWVTLYQWVCFPIYGVARVRRRDYFVLDRHKLAYLNGIEKVNCTFCSYANGLIGYVREVAARTEEYWCPIKHGRAIPVPHPRYHFFVDYGDAERYRRELALLRHALRREHPRSDRIHAARRSHRR